MSAMNIYYVYAYLRSDGTPYYIGKGKGNRAYGRHRHISVPKDKTMIVLLHENMSEENAFAKEIELIAFHGRKNNGTGILRNHTDGGEGPSGWIATDETRRKLREAGTGKKLSDKHRRKISESKTGEKNPNYGKKHSDETRQKMSEANKAAWARRRLTKYTYDENSLRE